MKRLVLALLVACSGTAKPVDKPLLPPADDKPAPVVEWSKLTGNIKTVTVHADATLVPKVKELFAGEVGKPIDRRRLRGALTNALAVKGVSDIDASAKQLDDGVELVLDVAPMPTLHDLVAREVGGAAIPLPGQLTGAIGLALDPSLLDSVAAMLRDQYLAKGFTDVGVEWKQTEPQKGQADVTIEITPGRASTITTVEFKGAAKVKPAELEKVIKDDVAPNAPFSTLHVEHAALLIAAYYYDRGFVMVKIDAPKPGGIAGPAVFTITEGAQFKLGKIEIKGASADDAKKYRALVKAKTGDVFSRAILADAIQKIQAEAKGMVVTPLTDVKQDKKLIDLTIDISKA